MKPHLRIGRAPVLPDARAKAPCEESLSCTRRWEALEETSSSATRYCGDCRKNVFRVNTPEQLHVAGLLARCVALSQDSDFFSAETVPPASGALDREPCRVGVRVPAPLMAGRIDALRLAYPALFDDASKERDLLDGKRVALGTFDKRATGLLLADLKIHAPEFIITLDD